MGSFLLVYAAVATLSGHKDATPVVKPKTEKAVASAPRWLEKKLRPMVKKTAIAMRDESRGEIWLPAMDSNHD